MKRVKVLWVGSIVGSFALGAIVGPSLEAAWIGFNHARIIAEMQARQPGCQQAGFDFWNPKTRQCQKAKRFLWSDGRYRMTSECPNSTYKDADGDPRCATEAEIKSW